MAAPPLKLSSCEAGFAASPHPVWVLDMDAISFLWVNDATLALWNASERDELLSRDIASGAPAKVTARLDDAINRVRTGEHLREEWAFYPRGEPMLVLLDLRPIELDDGRIAMLNQVMPVTNDASHSVQRALAVSRHLSVIAAFVDAQGQVLSRNPAAMEAFGEHDQWSQWFADPSEAAPLIEAALAGETVKTQTRVSARGELRWHLIEVERLRDPVSGETGVVVEHHDETARLEAESLAEARARQVDEIGAALEIVERQRNEILALSAPILDLGSQMLAVPIIGRFDEDQSSALTTKLLDAVSARGVRAVILDLTGVAAIDDTNAEHLRRLIASLELLGAAPVLTGIRPEVARQLSSSPEPIDVPTLRSLAVALEYTFAKR